MAGASRVYTGSPLPEAKNGEAELKRQIFPVGTDGRTGIASRTVECDAHVEGVFNREDGQPDVWRAQVFGDDGDGAMLEVELPMTPFGLSDLDPHDGQGRYQQELILPLEEMLGRTGLSILVHY